MFLRFLRRFGLMSYKMFMSVFAARATFDLFKIAGIPVGVHLSWFPLLALVTWSIATGFFPTFYPGWNGAQYWATGFAAALLLFVSVLVHEFAHSVMARSRGIEVEGITLFMLGGVSRLGAEPRRAWEEFVIAFVGPATSIILSGAFFMAWWPLQDTGSPLEAVLFYLALVNLVVGFFNLIPAYPLDGGRIFRSAVWAVSGNARRATVIASWVGQAFGIAFVTWGIVRILQGAYGGMLMGILGVFLFMMAGFSGRRAKLPLVSEAMQTDPRVVAASYTVYEAAKSMLNPSKRMAVYVCSEDDTLLGRFTTGDAMEVPEYLWNYLTVSEVMTEVPMPSVSPSDWLFDVLDLLQGNPVGEVPVLDGDRLVGTLSAADALRHLRSD